MIIKCSSKYINVCKYNRLKLSIDSHINKMYKSDKVLRDILGLNMFVSRFDCT